LGRPKPVPKGAIIVLGEHFDGHKIPEDEVPQENVKIGNFRVSYWKVGGHILAIYGHDCTITHSISAAYDNLKKRHDEKVVA
jgi:hypothetical protein